MKLCFVLAVISVTADPCIQLDTMLALGGVSYMHGEVCHSLFWLNSRGSGHICVHSISTAHSCLEIHPVKVLEALSIVLSGGIGVMVTSSRPIVAITTPAPVQGIPVKSNARVEAQVRSLENPRDSKVVIDIIAMGDCGVSEHALAPTAQVLSSAFNNRDASFLLGDLFYPLGIDRRAGANDPRLDKLASTLSERNDKPMFAILGNHDRDGDWEAEIKYSRKNPRWQMPGRYYFSRISKGDLDVCSWFLDTDKKEFDLEQKEWLIGTLSSQGPSCHWKVVSGHHFIFSGGEYEDNIWLITHLLPVLDRFRVDLYLAGHEHQSQVLKLDRHAPLFLIAGALGDIRDKPVRGHEGLQYINKRDVAFLHLKFTASSVIYSFIKSHKPDMGTVLYTGSSSKH